MKGTKQKKLMLTDRFDESAVVTEQHEEVPRRVNLHKLSEIRKKISSPVGIFVL